jgi:hypothetical protein
MIATAAPALSTRIDQLSFEIEAGESEHVREVDHLRELLEPDRDRIDDHRRPSSART